MVVAGLRYYFVVLHSELSEKEYCIQCHWWISLGSYNFYVNRVGISSYMIII